MVSLFHGSDISAVRLEALQAARDACGTDGEVRVITPDNFSLSHLEDALGAASLFHAREVILIDTLSEDAAAFALLLSILPALEESKNFFYVIETKLLTRDLSPFKKHAEKIVERVASEKKEFNAFALSDALRERDKKTLWILLQEAWAGGRSNEEIIGTLFWQLKMLRLAQYTQNADEAGQKSFVYDKAKRALKKFQGNDLDRLSEELLVVYHEGHSGVRDIGQGLEAWVLKI